MVCLGKYLFDFILVIKPTNGINMIIYLDPKPLKSLIIIPTITNNLYHRGFVREPFSKVNVIIFAGYQVFFVFQRVGFLIMFISNHITVIFSLVLYVVVRLTTL